MTDPERPTNSALERYTLLRTEWGGVAQLVGRVLIPRRIAYLVYAGTAYVPPADLRRVLNSGRRWVADDGERLAAWTADRLLYLYGPRGLLLDMGYGIRAWRGDLAAIRSAVEPDIKRWISGR